MGETYKTLTERWGVLLDYQALSCVLRRSPDGLRLSLAQNRTVWAKQINAAKVKIGRRVLFRTEQIAKLIDTLPKDDQANDISIFSNPPRIPERSSKVSRMPRVVR